MFTPKTTRIEDLSKQFPQVCQALDAIFGRGAANLYVDYGNVRNWSKRLGWHVDLKRLKQLVDSFSGPTISKLYYGTLNGDDDSHKLIRDAEAWGYSVLTKPVKIIRHSIDVSSISKNSPDIIRNFICGPLLQTFSLEMITALNSHLRALNRAGTLYFEDKKCNFDVEIGRDLQQDMIIGEADTFALWSCDSDFASSLEEGLEAGKNIVVFGVAGVIARELNMLRPKGLQIYDVRKLREFICWPRELNRH